MGSGLRALVVCDDAERFAFETLESERWEIEIIPTAGALERLFEIGPHLLLLDVADVDDAVNLCTAVRERSRLPIMVMSRRTGKEAEDELVAGLQAGATAFVSETVGPQEFVARVRAVMRREPRTRPATDDQVIIVGPVVLSRASRQVTVHGRPVAMPRREFDILELLMSNAGRVVPRSLLMRELWGTHRKSQALDVQTRRLRARLAAEEGLPRIVTIRGVGYRFADEVDLTPTDLEIDLASTHRAAPRSGTNGHRHDDPVSETTANTR